MSINFNGIKMKAWHFITAIFLLTILVYLLDKWDVKQYPVYTSDDHFAALNDINIQDSTFLHNSFILFHDSCSESSMRMINHYNCLIKDKHTESLFFTVNVDKHPHLTASFNISGFPSILIFKNGKEIKRIVGVVPVYNLEKIYRMVHN